MAVGLLTLERSRAEWWGDTPLVLPQRFDQRLGLVAYGCWVVVHYHARLASYLELFQIRRHPARRTRW